MRTIKSTVQATAVDDGTLDHEKADELVDLIDQAVAVRESYVLDEATGTKPYRCALVRYVRPDGVEAWAVRSHSPNGDPQIPSTSSTGSVTWLERSPDAGYQEYSVSDSFPDADAAYVEEVRQFAACAAQGETFWDVSDVEGVAQGLYSYQVQISGRGGTTAWTPIDSTPPDPDARGTQQQCDACSGTGVLGRSLTSAEERDLHLGDLDFSGARLGGADFDYLESGDHDFDDVARRVAAAARARHDLDENVLVRVAFWVGDPAREHRDPATVLAMAATEPATAPDPADKDWS